MDLRIKALIIPEDAQRAHDMLVAELGEPSETHDPSSGSTRWHGWSWNKGSFPYMRVGWFVEDCSEDWSPGEVFIVPVWKNTLKRQWSWCDFMPIATLFEEGSYNALSLKV